VLFELEALREAAEPLSAPAATATPTVSLRRGRILVVDDQEMIRLVVSEMLKGDHEILTVDSGRAARETIRKDQHFDLILCDLMMADVSGIELHAWLVESYPELADRVAFITGGVFTPHTEQYLAGISNRVIQKPFARVTLKKTVGDLLALARDPAR
jgi:CheY-like chemotaxis protein